MGSACLILHWQYNSKNAQSIANSLNWLLCQQNGFTGNKRHFYCSIFLSLSHQVNSLFHFLPSNLGHHHIHGQRPSSHSIWSVVDWLEQPNIVSSRCPWYITAANRYFALCDNGLAIATERSQAELLSSSPLHPSHYLQLTTTGKVPFHSGLKPECLNPKQYAPATPLAIKD